MDKKRAKKQTNKQTKTLTTQIPCFTVVSKFKLCTIQEYHAIKTGN